MSQALNAALYNLIAFGGVYSWETVGSIIATSYIIFIFTSLLDTPVVYLARKIYHKKFEGKNEDEITNRHASPTFGISFRKKKTENAVNTECLDDNFSNETKVNEEITIIENDKNENATKDDISEKDSENNDQKY